MCPILYCGSRSYFLKLCSILFLKLCKILTVEIFLIFDPMQEKDLLELSGGSFFFRWWISGTIEIFWCVHVSIEALQRVVHSRLNVSYCLHLLLTWRNLKGICNEGLWRERGQYSKVICPLYLWRLSRWMTCTPMLTFDINASVTTNWAMDNW